jgi:hypothetical protein
MAKPYEAVLIVTVPPEWRPTRVFHFSPTFTEARYHAARLTLNVATEIARAHSADKLRTDSNGPIGTWAIQIRALKTRAFGSPFSRQTPRDPSSRRSTSVSKGGGV